jgi:hypothetical protein
MTILLLPFGFVRFFQLLTKVYGESWKKAGSIEFVATDGYKSAASVAKMIKQSKESKLGVIALREVENNLDDKRVAIVKKHGVTANGFTPRIKGDKVVDPGPLYLVWQGFPVGSGPEHAANLSWPYQLAEINLVK